MKKIEVVAAIIHDEKERIFVHSEDMETLRMAGSFLGARWNLASHLRKP